ncbi:MAG: DUF6438 domain-containing protein [Hymenobacter sp.]
MRVFLWLLVFSLAGPACAQRKMARVGRAATAPTPRQWLSPSRCWCSNARRATAPAQPTWLAVFADGRVEYDGQRFVLLRGKQTLRLPPDTVAALLAQARRIGFSQLDERYAGLTSDLPATIITVHPAGLPAKSVFAAENIPANLQGYIKYLGARLDPLAGQAPEKLMTNEYGLMTNAV